MVSKVAFFKTKPSLKAVRAAVNKAMTKCCWETHLKGDKILLKINAVSDLPIPGVNTSPWVLDGVLGVITKKKPPDGITIIDTDTSVRKQFYRAAEVWGYNTIAKKYGVGIKNLSEDKYVKSNGIYLPKIVLEADALVSVPVIKTHTWAEITCSLKNQFGLYARSRHQMHLNLGEAIPLINSVIKPYFTVIDGTLCLEDGGPVLGKTKTCNAILASDDLVAADSACAYFMGLNPKKIPYITSAHRMGVGSMDYTIIGDEFTQEPFKPTKQNLVSIWHRRLMKTPLGAVLFRTPLFLIPAAASTLYRGWWWKNVYRKRYLPEIIDSSYMKQFNKKYFS